jgi:LuxR family maltose regulon positive regulatory protein
LSEPQALAALLTHALVELARQHPGSANDFVQRGLAGSRGGTDRTLRLAFGVVAVQVAVARGDIAGALTADSLVTEGLARTPAAPHLLLRWAAIAGAEALLLAGRPDDALARVSAPADRPGLASAWERVCLARIRLALGESDAAEALITPLLRSVDTPRESAVTAWVLHAVAATRDHRDSAALTALTSAIDLAQPEGIRRPFLQPGGAPPELLTRYRDLGGRHDAFAADLLAQLHPQRFPVCVKGFHQIDGDHSVGVADRDPLAGAVTRQQIERQATVAAPVRFDRQAEVVELVDQPA